MILGRWWFPIPKTCPVQRNWDFSSISLMLVILAFSKTSILETPLLQWMLKTMWRQWNRSRSRKWCRYVTYVTELYWKIERKMALYILIYVLFVRCLLHQLHWHFLCQPMVDILVNLGIWSNGASDVSEPMNCHQLSQPIVMWGEWYSSRDASWWSISVFFNWLQALIAGQFLWIKIWSVANLFRCRQ